MSFAIEKSRIEFPSRWFTIGIALITMAMAWCMVFLDQARGAAYFTLPVVMLLLWCNDAKITYVNTRKIKLCVWAFCFVYWIAGNAFLLQVISVEGGRPMISSGLIYDLSALMARKAPQA
jgi:CDP-diglyceride synthetase